MSVVEARFVGGSIEVTALPLSHAPDVEAVRIDLPGYRCDLFPHEAEQLARALTEAAADAHTTGVRELRRPRTVDENLITIDN